MMIRCQNVHIYQLYSVLTFVHSVYKNIPVLVVLR